MKKCHICKWENVAKDCIPFMAGAADGVETFPFIFQKSGFQIHVPAQDLGLKYGD